MQALLITSKNKKRAIEQAEIIAKENKAHSLDIDLINFEKTVGIEDVRQFQKKLFLKPFQGKTKTLILNIEDSLTDEAQNALLKALEEPPNNTIIILLAPSMEIFLPTVLSRCSTIVLKEPKEIESLDISQHLNILMSLSQLGIGDRLKLTQENSKTKEDAKKFLENLIIASRSLLFDNVGNKIPNSSNLPNSYFFLKALKSLSKTYKIISTTNSNPRLVLENLLLSL